MSYNTDSSFELPDSLEREVMDILDEPDDVRSERLQALYRTHPEHASRIRARLEVADRLCGQLNATFEATSQVGAQIGPYRILETLGEGGMGTVHLAEQRTPVYRRVALKVIKLGMDTKEVLARFEAERQALAIMDHPCIAKVLDAGSTNEGRSYFAMEYVPGVSLTTFCDHQRLGVRDRLELFIQVCGGVQHAHHKGILHRDLKPSNVLVAAGSRKPLPKIIDFGLARATDLQLTQRTLFTRRGAILGTPEYMSPEQAEMSGLDVDTRTDIYSLGVMLYELLTGTLPFEPSELRKGGLHELHRRIREDDPQKPSDRVTSSAGTNRPAGVNRSVDPPGLARELRGDLDWIVMRALEKDRSRRYQTAAELAADVESYLRDEPVMATPPSMRYRLRKLLRRYRVEAIAVASVFLALIGGLVISTALYLDARAARESEAATRAVADTNRDALLLKALLTEADRALPAWPEDVGFADRWLAQATALQRNAESYRAELGAVEGRATRTSDSRPSGSGSADSTLAALEQAYAQHETFRLEKEVLGSFTNYRANYMAALLRDLAGQIEDARRANAVTGGWSFADNRDAALYPALVELVNGLPALNRSMREVEDRRARALAVDDVCFGEHGEMWESTIRSIADREANPQYGGLQIERQRGLFPLGKDPRSGLFEFAHSLSGEPPRRVAGRLEFGPESGIVFVLIPPGVVKTGSPRIRGTEVEPFFLAKHELTQGQWQRLTGRNPSYYAAGTTVAGVVVDARHPVTLVSWHECVEVLTPLGLTLPTLAQFEWAARARTEGRWYSGDDRESLRKSANFADLSLTRQWPTSKGFDWDDGYAIHAPVGSFEPNGFGLYDMAGNVTEWCLDLLSDPDSNATDADRNDLVRRSMGGWSFQNAPSGALENGSWFSIMKDISVGVRAARALSR